MLGPEVSPAEVEAVRNEVAQKAKDELVVAVLAHASLELLLKRASFVLLLLFSSSGITRVCLAWQDEFLTCLVIIRT